MATEILWTLLFVMISLSCGLGLGRYVLPYREPVEDWSDKRLWRELDAIRLELDLRGEYTSPPDDDDPPPGWPDDEERRPGRIDRPVLHMREIAPARAPESPSAANDPPDGWTPAPGDRIAAWARTGPRAIRTSPPLQPVNGVMPASRGAGLTSTQGRPRSANRFMDLVALHLTEYDLHHMQRAAA